MSSAKTLDHQGQGEEYTCYYAHFNEVEVGIKGIDAILIHKGRHAGFKYAGRIPSLGVRAFQGRGY